MSDIPMKRVVIGSKTYEIVDEYAREHLEDVYAELSAEEDITSRITRGKLIALDGGIGSTAPIGSPTANQGFGYFVIPWSAGNNVKITARGGTTARTWATLDSEAKILTVADANAQATDLTITASVDGYVVINCNLAFPYSVKFTGLNISSRIESITGNIDAQENKAEIVLPSTVYGVIGQEFDLYKGNALMYGNIGSVASVKFVDFINQWVETDSRFSCLPNATRNQYPQFSLYKYSIKSKDAFKNLHLIITDPASLSGKSRDILVIGDSKVAGGRLPQVLKILCTNAGMDVGKLKGSLYSSAFDVYHEGRSGWSSVDYMAESKGSTANLFYHNGTFDFSYYMEQQNYSSMDYVFINLGTNDYANASGLGSDAYVATFISNIETMINSIHTYDPNIKVIVGLAEGVCTAQKSSASEEELSNLNARARLLNKACIAKWDNSTFISNKVWLCPIYLSMDMENDYVMTEEPLSQWDGTYNTGKTRFRITDKMHQNNVGYAKNATYMFSTLAYIESL